MKLKDVHLGYCTNIHSGETWKDHFLALQGNFPSIKQKVSPHADLGIGLRLSDIASRTLAEGGELKKFRNWLQENGGYVFTINGFPFGDFHHAVVKDRVHAPDWTTSERLDYTKRLFVILSELLPEGEEGGVSTSPLTYRHWFPHEGRQAAAENATLNIVQVAADLIRHRHENGKPMHLDIEPEPDGLLESGEEFIEWYENILEPIACREFSRLFGMNSSAAGECLREHITLCYDVCHFAIGYESHSDVLKKLAARNIRVGKVQVSAALKADLSGYRAQIASELQRYNEPTYLHQVVARQPDGQLSRYADLPQALAQIDNPNEVEWRAHFHVPVFLSELGVLSSTQNDIRAVLSENKRQKFTGHLEVETYTWEVLPEALRLPIDESIARELNWVKENY